MFLDAFQQDAFALAVTREVRIKGKKHVTSIFVTLPVSAMINEYQNVHGDRDLPRYLTDRIQCSSKLSQQVP